MDMELVPGPSYIDSVQMDGRRVTLKLGWKRVAVRVFIYPHLCKG